jgi:hypothetical protein
MNVLGSLLIYASLVASAVGIASLVKPLRLVGIRTRKTGLVVLGLGLAGLIAAVALPPREKAVQSPQSRLDDLVPEFQFREFHVTEINAPKDAVYYAIRAVGPEEIRFFRMLTAIRFGKPLGTERRPILDSFTTGWFLLLADDSGREIVFGRAGDGRRKSAHDAEAFIAANYSPLIKIAMNFRIQEISASRCTLSTETRVYASGGHVRRGFATYWRLIYPGSALMRRMWLQAIKTRAEA